MVVPTPRPSTKTWGRWTAPPAPGSKPSIQTRANAPPLPPGSAPTCTRRSNRWCCRSVPKDRQVQVIRRSGKADVLALSPVTERWLRHGYHQRMSTEAVRRDLGETLAHGEPERGMGQGEAAEQPVGQSPGQAFWDGELAH